MVSNTWGGCRAHIGLGRGRPRFRGMTCRTCVRKLAPRALYVYLCPCVSGIRVMTRTANETDLQKAQTSSASGIRRATLTVDTNLCFGGNRVRNRHCQVATATIAASMGMSQPIVLVKSRSESMVGGWKNARKIVFFRFVCWPHQVFY